MMMMMQRNNNTVMVILIVICLAVVLVTTTSTCTTTVDAFQIASIDPGRQRRQNVAACSTTSATESATIVPNESTTLVRLLPSSSSTNTNDNNNSNKVPLPPVIQQIANERAEFQMNLGRAMDTLRKDMPYILSQTPDFSIYHEDISVIDPSGVQLKGLDKYKSAFAFLQTFTKFWFHHHPSSRPNIQFRMVYDFCRTSIRISWHIVLVSKFLPILNNRPLHIDGISYYQIDVDSGKIIEHKIETLIVNNTPIAPPYGILSILQQQDVLLGNALRQPMPQGIPAHIVSSIR